MVLLWRGVSLLDAEVRWVPALRPIVENEKRIGRVVLPQHGQAFGLGPSLTGTSNVHKARPWRSIRRTVRGAVTRRSGPRPILPCAGPPPSALGAVVRPVAVAGVADTTPRRARPRT